MSAFQVRIDGEITWLRLHHISGSRGYCYLTPGNTREHHFQKPLEVGQRFTTSGHFYEVLGEGHE